MAVRAKLQQKWRAVKIIQKIIAKFAASVVSAKPKLTENEE